MGDKDKVTAYSGLVPVGTMTEAEFGETETNIDLLWKKDKDDKGINPEIKKLGIDALVATGVDLLQKFEGKGGYFRQMADVVVALRLKHYTTMTDKAGKKVRDLQGRGSEYRLAVRRMYIEAGIPRATESGMSAAIRYHVRKLIWDEATPEEKRLLNLKDPYSVPKDAAPATEEPEDTNGQGVDEDAAEGEAPQGVPEPPEGNDPILLMQHVIGTLERISTLEPTEEVRERMAALILEAESWITRIQDLLTAGLTSRDEREAAAAEAVA